MMCNVALRAGGGRADWPVEIGSTIPRAIRMGVKATAAPSVPVPVQTVNTRDGQRFVPHKTKTSLTLTNGKRIDARIINVSSAAVAVEADLAGTKPSAVTMVGARPVKPGRRIALGAVFLFVKLIPKEVCTEHLVL